MAHLVLKDTATVFAEYNLTSDNSSVSISYGAAEQDNTSFGSTAISRLGGLKTVGASFECFFNSPNEGGLFTNIKTSGKPITIAPEGLTAGNRAFMFEGLMLQVNPTWTLGEVTGISATASGVGDLGRGVVEYVATETATGAVTSTGTQLGALTASQAVIACVHCTSYSGDGSLSIDVESDDNSGFTSATSRGSFTAISGATSEIIQVNGAVTDDYWRVNGTITGTTVNMTLVFSFGIITI